MNGYTEDQRKEIRTALETSTSAIWWNLWFLRNSPDLPQWEATTPSCAAEWVWNGYASALAHRSHEIQFPEQ